MSNRFVTCNFQFNANENEVKQIFSKYGEILFLKVLHTRLKNFVLIEYSCEESANNAILDCKEIFGYPCQMKFFEEFQSKVVSKQEIYSFGISTQPFLNLICEKVQESINLVNMEKIKFVQNTLQTSDNSCPLSSLDINLDKITTKEEIKQLCGERIYSLAKIYSSEKASKIAGILLQAIDETDLVKLVDDENLLRKKIEEIFNWLKINCEQSQNFNSIPTDLPGYKSVETNANNVLLSTLDQVIRQLEFFKYLNADVLKEKINLCELLYPLVTKYGGLSIEKIMARLMEMDNAILKYLSTDTIALQNSIQQICQQIINKEFLNRLGSMAAEVKQNIINIDNNIQNQFLELKKVDSPYFGMHNWVDNYKKYLFNFMEYKLNALGRINQIITEIVRINNDSSPIIPQQQSGINVSDSHTGLIGILPGIPKHLPISMPALLPFFIPSSNLQQNFKPVYCISPDQNIDPSMIIENNMIAPQFAVPFNSHQVDIVDMNRQNSESSTNNEREGYNFINESRILDKNNLGENMTYKKGKEMNELHSDLNECGLSITSSESCDQISNANSMESILSEESSVKIDKSNFSNSDDEYYDIISGEHTEKSIQKKVQPIRHTDDSELFLENLHPDVDEEILLSIFESFGKILSIRLMRDPETQKSLGLAYVTFEGRSDAKIAMDQVNFRKLNGNECRIKWSESDKVVRNSEIGNVFIKNLDLTLGTKDITDIFKRFGEIISCKVQTNENGESLGFGFVRYDSEKTAEMAIKKMNGKFIGNKVIYAGKFLSKKRRACAEEKSTNCYVKNLEKSLNNENFRELFAEFGEIVSAIVQVDRNGISKGRGFVAFKHHQDALRAISTMNGKIIKDQYIEVSIAQNQMTKGNQNVSNCNVYINKLDFIIDDERLSKEFSNFGRITSAKVMRDKENISLGYGFVCYSSPPEALMAVNNMNGKILEGKKIFVNICQKHSKKENSKICSVNDSSPVVSMANHQESIVSFPENPNFSKTKQTIGEFLYLKVHKYAGDMTGKIVGMFLELDNRELIIMLEDENALFTKIQMAFNEINKHKYLSDQ